MKRLTLVLLLLASSLFAAEFDFKTDIIDASLKSSFKTYWNYRADKKFYKTYSYELPYLDYLHSQDWYEDFFAKSMRLKKIVIKKVQCKDEKCKIAFVFYTKSMPKDGHYFTDEWVNLDNKWYHSYNDNPLPPM